MARSENIYVFERYGGSVEAVFTVKYEAYAWLRRMGARTPQFARGLMLFRMSDGDRWPDGVSMSKKKVALPLEEGK